MSALLAGLALGFASSAHCVAMCGPLVLAAGRTAGPSSAARVLQPLLYHTGRTVTYALLAGIVGLAGETLVMHGLGRTLAVAAGTGLLIAAAGSLRGTGIDRLTGGLASRVVVLGTPMLRWARTRRVAGPLAAGVLNGLLPCGMVYGALTTAAATGSAGAAMLLMTGFGVGTAAVLIAMSAGAASMPPTVRARLRPVAPVVLAVAAVILITRGVAAPHPHSTTPPSAAGHVHRWIDARR
jgi:sulfite exporter TauE/SafE